MDNYSEFILYPLMFIMFKLLPFVYCILLILFILRKKVTLQTKINIFQAIVVPVVLYLVIAMIIVNIRTPGSIVYRNYRSGMFSMYGDQLDEAYRELQLVSYLKQKDQTLENLFGFLGYQGSSITVEQIDDAVDVLDGGSTDLDSLRSCFNEGDKRSIHYFIRNHTMGSFDTLNVFSDGVILVMDRGRTFSTQLIKYESQGCFDEMVLAISDDDKLGEDLVYEIGMSEYVIEYFDLNCDGQQVNDWWQGPGNKRDVPWVIFRKSMTLVLNEAIENGERLSDEEYLNELQAREVEYQFRSLTGHDFSSWYLDRSRY